MRLLCSRCRETRHLLQTELRISSAFLEVQSLDVFSCSSRVLVKVLQKGAFSRAHVNCGHLGLFISASISSARLLDRSGRL